MNAITSITADPAADLRARLEIAADHAEDMLSRALSDTAYNLAWTCRREACIRSREATVAELERTVKTCRSLMIAAMECERIAAREAGL